MNKTILTIDIGNTSITAGIFVNNILKKRFAIPTVTVKKKRSAEISRFLKAHIKGYKVDISIIASVVPEINIFFKKMLKASTGTKIITITKNMNIGIKNKYKAPRQVGQDRLVTAMAAKTLYGAPAIVIDIGTALTIDIVSKNSEYLGGIIYPGPHISAKALAEHTALLPLASPKPAKGLIGSTTSESIQNGLYYGMIEIITGIVKRFQSNCPELKKARIIATGGFIKEIRAELPKKIKIDLDLMLKGLCIIAARHT